MAGRIKQCDVRIPIRSTQLLSVVHWIIGLLALEYVIDYGFFKGNLFLNASAVIAFIYLAFFLKPFLSPEDYTITPTEIVLRKWNSVIRFSRENIAKVEIVDGKALFSDVEKTSSWFGYWAQPYELQGNSVSVYAAYLKSRLVMLHMVNDSAIILSPRNCDKFVDTFNQISGIHDH